MVSTEVEYSKVLPPHVQIVYTRMDQVMPTQAFFDNTNLANGDIQNELDKALDQAVRETLGKFSSTVATWNHKPKFEVDREPAARVVGTNDKIYEIVSETGSKPHLIRPRNGKVLRFSSKYRAKTRKGILGSSSGGASGSPVFAKSVNHPGFEAREFVKEIQAQMDVRMEKLVDEAMRKLYG